MSKRSKKTRFITNYNPQAGPHEWTPEDVKVELLKCCSTHASLSLQRWMSDFIVHYEAVIAEVEKN